MEWRWEVSFGLFCRLGLPSSRVHDCGEIRTPGDAHEGVVARASPIHGSKWALCRNVLQLHAILCQIFVLLVVVEDGAIAPALLGAQKVDEGRSELWLLVA